MYSSLLVSTEVKTQESIHTKWAQRSNTTWVRKPAPQSLYIVNARHRSLWSMVNNSSQDPFEICQDRSGPVTTVNLCESQIPQKSPSMVISSASYPHQGASMVLLVAPHDPNDAAGEIWRCDHVDHLQGTWRAAHGEIRRKRRFPG